MLKDRKKDVWKGTGYLGPFAGQCPASLVCTIVEKPFMLCYPLKGIFVSCNLRFCFEPVIPKPAFHKFFLLSFLGMLTTRYFLVVQVCVSFV